MVRKKPKSIKSKKTGKTKTISKKQPKTMGRKKKTKEGGGEDLGIIVIEDDLRVDKEAELEERRAYLEEARSQEAFD